MTITQVIAAAAVSAILFTSCGNMKADVIEPVPAPAPETIIMTTPEPPPKPTETPQYYTEITHPTWDGYPEPHYVYTDAEIEMLAKTVYGEANVCGPEEQRLVVWTILQRVDDERFPDTIAEVITAKSQFCGYHESHPVDEDIKALCLTEVMNWNHGAEPPTMEPYAPDEAYYFFDGDGWHNWFREEW